MYISDVRIRGKLSCPVCRDQCRIERDVEATLDLIKLSLQVSELGCVLDTVYLLGCRVPGWLGRCLVLSILLISTEGSLVAALTVVDPGNLSTGSILRCT